jgi:two-component system chemotaxis response regulator CheB
LCAAKGDAVGVLLSPTGEDGPAGLNAMLKAGGYGMAPAGLIDGEAIGQGFKLHKGAVSQPVAREALVAGIVKLCGK